MRPLSRGNTIAHSCELIEDHWNCLVYSRGIDSREQRVEVEDAVWTELLRHGEGLLRGEDLEGGVLAHGGFVGFALVALGTTQPELLTALAAARRGESGLVFGNLLGSNLFNSLMVGAAVFLANGATPYDQASGLPDEPLLVMVAVSWGVIWFMRTGRRIDRREAAFLIVAYAGLLGWLATNSATV